MLAQEQNTWRNIGPYKIYSRKEPKNRRFLSITKRKTGWKAEITKGRFTLGPELKLYTTSGESDEGQGTHKLCLAIEWLGWSLHAPLMRGLKGELQFGDGKAWGFWHMGPEMAFGWGDKRAYVKYPFQHGKFIDHWVLDPEDQEPVKMVPRKIKQQDGSFIFASDIAKELGFLETHPFHYRLYNGEIQATEATCFIERRRWKVAWTPFNWFKRSNITVDIHFADEMGSERGSWKGGTVGCSCEIKPEESIKEALARYELTADFCRPSRFREKTSSVAF